MRGRFLTLGLSLVALMAAVTLAGCDGRNPLLSDTKPDPTPIPVATPTPDPALQPDSRYFPLDKSTYAWHELAQTGVKPLAQAIVAAGYMVIVEAEQLTDPTIIKALIAASKLPSTISQGTNVSTMVVLDDTGANAAINRPAYEALQAAGVGVYMVHNIPNAQPNFKRLRSNTILVATGATYDQNTRTGAYSGALFMLNGPLTTDSLAKAGSSAAMSTDSRDITEAFKALVGAINPAQGTFVSTNPNILISPNSARKQLQDLLAGADSSIDLAVESLADPALVSTLIRKAQEGVAVRIVLPSTETAGRDSLKAAGLDQVKLAPDVTGLVAVLDGKRVLQGGFALSAAGIDEDHSMGFNLSDPTLVRGGVTAFDAKWSAGQ